MFEASDHRGSEIFETAGVLRLELKVKGRFGGLQFVTTTTSIQQECKENRPITIPKSSVAHG